MTIYMCGEDGRVGARRRGELRFGGKGKGKRRGRRRRRRRGGRGAGGGGGVGGGGGGGEGGEEEEEEEVHLVDIEGGVDVVDVAVGEGHVLAVTREGRLWALGEGKWGQLGSGRRTFEKSWIEVKGLDGSHRVVGVACGFWSSFVITQRSEE